MDMYDEEADYAMPAPKAEAWLGGPVPGKTFDTAPVQPHTAPAAGDRAAPLDLNKFAYTAGRLPSLSAASRPGPGAAQQPERLGRLHPASAVLAPPAPSGASRPQMKSPHFVGGAASTSAQVAQVQEARAASKPMLQALIQRLKKGGEPASQGGGDGGLAPRRQRSAASLGARAGGGRGAPPPKRSRSVPDFEASDEDEDEELDESSDDDEEEEDESEAGTSSSEGEDDVLDVDAAPPPRPRAQPPRRVTTIIIDDSDQDTPADGDASEHSGSGSGEDDEDEDDDSPFGSTLDECDKIAADLRAALGGIASGDDARFAGADENTEGLRLLSADEVRAACTVGVQQPATPPLKSYQVVGVNFLMLLHTRGVAGAILADEMGLGKTAQAISFLACVTSRTRQVAPDTPPAPHLVVAPASVLENWARELATWAPALRVRAYHGGGRAAVRDEIDEAMDASPDGAPPFDVLLCCYTMFERDTADQSEDRKWLRSFQFSYAVLDEAHAVKNRASQRAARLRMVLNKCAPKRLMLTGTPLQNDLTELLALLELLMPSLFNISGTLLDAAEAKAKKGDGGAASERAIARVRHMLGPFVLRRLKSEVLSQLVPKTQHMERLGMEAQQGALYAAAVAAVRREVAAKAAARAGKRAYAPEAPVSELEKAVGASRLKALFTYLRKVANHPLLVRQRFTQAAVDEVVRVTHARGVFGSGAPLKKVRDHVQSLSDFALHSLCSDDRLRGALAHLRLPTDAPLQSGKAQRLAALLPGLRAAGSRALIFSQWKIQLDVLEWVMQALGLSYYRLDGSTPVEERQALVDAYNAPGSDVFAFLLSTRAGGQGINLTGADTVILHDCDFNPQIDRQAEDRSHRLGQTRPVSIYRLVTEDTVDARIVDIAQRKLSLDAAVLSSDKDAKAAESRSMAELLRGLLEEAPAGGAPAAAAESIVIEDMLDD